MDKMSRTSEELSKSFLVVDDITQLTLDSAEHFFKT
jgi:hypothetical protein